MINIFVEMVYYFMPSVRMLFMYFVVFVIITGSAFLTAH